MTLARIPQVIIVFLTLADVETNVAHSPFNFKGFGISRCRIMYDGRYYSQKWVTEMYGRIRDTRLSALVL